MVRGIHNSSIGRTITRVVREIEESKDLKLKLSKIMELYLIKRIEKYESCKQGMTPDHNLLQVHAGCGDGE
jgi:hypothetical protein